MVYYHSNKIIAKIMIFKIVVDSCMRWRSGEVSFYSVTLRFNLINVQLP